MKRWLVQVLVACAASAAAAPPVLLDFSAAERRQIAQHGPWPPPAARDPGNALAGKPQAIALGERLFFDTRLSPDGRFACASCHLPQLAFADGRARSPGRETLDRNAPTLLNAVHQRWYGWDGAADSLWSQAIRPLLEAREMAGSGAHLRALVLGDAALACRWRELFGADAAASDEAALVQGAKLIGAYVGSLVSARTPFDRFRDALRRGERRTAAAYPPAAQRGLRLFIGRGRCALCHAGPLFSNGEFADIGVPFFVRPGVVDPGRHGGIAQLLASPYNLLGRWSDARDAAVATKTRHVVLQPRNFGEFKVPALREVARTAPYMHDGQLATLGDVVRHYSEIDRERLHADGERLLEPLRLSEGERADLVAFLETLSAPIAATPRARPPARARARCPA